MTGNDVTRPEVTGSEPEVTSIDQKSPEVAVEKDYMSSFGDV